MNRFEKNVHYTLVSLRRSTCEVNCQPKVVYAFVFVAWR